MLSRHISITLSICWRACMGAMYTQWITLVVVPSQTKELSMQSKPSIVFVHGIWADGSSFNKLIPTLQAEGYEVLAAQYGLDSLAGDVAAVRRTLARVSSPAILVGHSYGGTLIPPPRTNPPVAGPVH